MNTKQQQEYILSCINDENESLVEPKDKVQFFVDSFNDEFNSDASKRIFPNMQKRIGYYLQGLPSCCTLAFYDEDIANIGKSWGYCQTEKKEATFVENWFNVCAFRIIQLCRKYKIDIE